MTGRDMASFFLFIPYNNSISFDRAIKQVTMTAKKAVPDIFVLCSNCPQFKQGWQNDRYHEVGLLSRATKEFASYTYHLKWW